MRERFSPSACVARHPAKLARAPAALFSASLSGYSKQDRPKTQRPMATGRSSRPTSVIVRLHQQCGSPGAPSAMRVRTSALCAGTYMVFVRRWRQSRGDGSSDFMRRGSEGCASPGRQPSGACMHYRAGALRHRAGFPLPASPRHHRDASHRGRHSLFPRHAGWER